MFEKQSRLNFFVVEKNCGNDAIIWGLPKTATCLHGRVAEINFCWCLPLSTTRPRRHVAFLDKHYMNFGWNNNNLNNLKSCPKKKLKQFNLKFLSISYLSVHHSLEVRILIRQVELKTLNLIWFFVKLFLENNSFLKRGNFLDNFAVL